MQQLASELDWQRELECFEQFIAALRGKPSNHQLVSAIQRVHVLAVNLTTQIESPSLPNCIPIWQGSHSPICQRPQLRNTKIEPFGFKQTDKRPVYLTIHGGGWTGRTPRYFYPFAQHFAELGMVAISMEYRLSSEAHGRVDDVLQNRFQSPATHLDLHRSQMAAGNDFLPERAQQASRTQARAFSTGSRFETSADTTKPTWCPSSLGLAALLAVRRANAPRRT